MKLKCVETQFASRILRIPINVPNLPRLHEYGSKLGLQESYVRRRARWFGHIFRLPECRRLHEILEDASVLSHFQSCFPCDVPLAALYRWARYEDDGGHKRWDAFVATLEIGANYRIQSYYDIEDMLSDCSSVGSDQSVRDTPHLFRNLKALISRKYCYNIIVRIFLYLQVVS